MDRGHNIFLRWNSNLHKFSNLDPTHDKCKMVAFQNYVSNKQEIRLN